MADRTGEGRARELLAAAEVGGFELPPPIVEAVRTLDNVARLLEATPSETSPDAAEEALIPIALAEIQAGGDVGDLGDRVLRARDEAERNAAHVRVLREVQERLRYSASQLLLDIADEIVTETGRAIAEIMREAAKYAPAIKGAATPEEVLRGGDAGVRAWRRLESLAQRYAAVRRAYGIVYGAVYRSQVSDATGLHTEFSNLAETYPAIRRTTEKPWPSAGPARLAWIALSPLKPWTPRPEELNAAFEAEKERVKAAQAEANARVQAQLAASR